MTRRRLLVLALLPALGLTAGACASVTSPALEIDGDAVLERDELLAEVDEIVEGLAELDPTFDPGPAGTVPATIPAAVLSVTAQTEILGAVLDEAGAEVTDVDRDLAQAQMAQFGTLTGIEVFDVRLTLLNERLAAVQRIGVDVANLDASAYSIQVDPRYGSWDPTVLSVVAPELPATEGGAPALVAEF